MEHQTGKVSLPERIELSFEEACRIVAVLYHYGEPRRAPANLIEDADRLWGVLEDRCKPNVAVNDRIIQGSAVPKTGTVIAMDFSFRECSWSICVAWDDETTEWTGITEMRRLDTE